MVATDEMCRVTISTTGHEVDVTLPAHLPIAELVPVVVDLIADDGFTGGDRHLTRVCGQVLDPTATLAQCSVPDGELLILTAVVRPPPVHRFDPATAVVDAATTRTTPVACRRVTWVLVLWAAAVLLVLLGRAALDPHASRHAAIAATAAVLALAGAVAAHRAHRDRPGAVGLGVLATVFAGVTAALASQGHPGLPHFLLAMSAISAASLLAWRLLDCASLIFLPLGATAMAASAVTTGAVSGWWPVSASGPTLATVSLAALAVSARLAVRSSGLSAAGLSDPELQARTTVAQHRLTAFVVTAAAAAALGTVVTAAAAPRPVVAAGFITTVGAALALRSWHHLDPYHVAALMVSSGVAVTSLIALCATKLPSTTPWMCGGLLTIGAGAVWFAQRGRMRVSAAARRTIAVLDLAVGAAVVPSAAAAAGAFATLPGMGLP